jgi:hypothetical protein
VRLLRWFWHGDAALAEPRHERLREASAGSALLWLLALWTAFCGLALLLFEGRVTQTLAGGLTDHAGQRLLGAQWLGLAAVYALAARRGPRERPLRWLAALVQLLTGLATSYSLVTGHGSPGAAFVCIVSFGFALLLTAFQLAGQPAYFPPEAAPPGHIVQHHEAAPRRIVHHDAADPYDARTERLDHYAQPSAPLDSQPAREQPARPRAEHSTSAQPATPHVGQAASDQQPAPAPRPRTPDDDLLGL